MRAGRRETAADFLTVLVFNRNTAATNKFATNSRDTDWQNTTAFITHSCYRSGIKHHRSINRMAHAEPTAAR